MNRIIQMEIRDYEETLTTSLGNWEKELVVDKARAKAGVPEAQPDIIYDERVIEMLRNRLKHL